MFGNLLIDKFRVSLKINDRFIAFELQKDLKNVLSRHFKENNYTVSFDKRYLRITFTPTLYLEDVRNNQDIPIINLEMISEETFLSLLQQIYNILGENAVVTWIDLTKNLLTSATPTEYITALSKLKLKYPYKQTDYQSKDRTLILASLKRSDDVNCRNLNRQINFYSKVDELIAKTKTRFLDNVELSDEEVKQIPGINYQEERRRLFLKGLNILRCEQRYKYTTNIKRITHFLTGSKSTNELTLLILIELLERKVLYSQLEEFYTQELRKYVFYNDICNEKNIKLNKHECIIRDLVRECGINLNDFQVMFEELGFKEQFVYTIKKLHYNTIGVCYEELYKKFGI